MKKIIIASLLAITMTLNLSAVFAQELPIKIVFDGKELQLYTPAIIEQGRTLVPLRNIFEGFGAEFAWDGSSSVITAEKPGTQIWLQIDNADAKVNGQAVKMDVPAKIVNGRTMVPLRFVSQAFGIKPVWIGERRTAVINVQTYKVARVVNGDTIKVDFNGSEEYLQLIGVDAPDPAHPTKGEQPYSREASDFTKAQLTGKMVSLEFDVQQRDKYGRLLAYVYYDGEMFNKTLVKEGYARILTIPPDVKYKDVFLKYEREAKDNNRGLWALENH